MPVGEQRRGPPGADHEHEHRRDRASRRRDEPENEREPERRGEHQLVHLRMKGAVERQPDVVEVEDAVREAGRGPSRMLERRARMRGSRP